MNSSMTRCASPRRDMAAPPVVIIIRRLLRDRSARNDGWGEQHVAGSMRRLRRKSVVMADRPADRGERALGDRSAAERCWPHRPSGAAKYAVHAADVVQRRDMKRRIVCAVRLYSITQFMAIATSLPHACGSRLSAPRRAGHVRQRRDVLGRDGRQRRDRR